MKAIVTSLLAVALLAPACTTEESSGVTEHSPVAAAASSANAAAGVTWDVPDGWIPQPDRPMRVATYALAENDPAECAVFHFPNTGGSVEANIARWVGQFEGTPEPKTSTRQISGLDVTLVDVAGTYLAPGGPMMKSTGKKSDYRLIGAIVSAPQGNVFFKTTGPASTLAEQEASFEKMIQSVQPST